MVVRTYCQAMRCATQVRDRAFCPQHAQMLGPAILAAAEQGYRPGLLALPMSAEAAARLEAVAVAIEHIADREGVPAEVANFYRVTSERWRNLLAREPLAPVRR